MKTELTSREAEILSQYRFAREWPSGKAARPLSTLLLETERKDFLEEVKRQVGVEDDKTAASLLVKRLAFVAVIYLHAMSAFDKRLDVSLDNIILIDDVKNGLWLPEFYFLRQDASTSPAEKRDEWREESIRHLFAENLYPLMRALSRETKIPMLILWENLSIYLFWLYETILPGMVKEQSEKDFSYLLHSAPGHLFGDFNNNPLKRYMEEPVYRKETQSFVRVRKTCCFSYKVKDGDYCTTCPIICKQKRE